MLHQPYPVADLAAQINQSRLVELLQQLIRIPSINPFDQEPGPDYRELEIANFYEQQMQDLGMLTSRRDVVEGRPNVFGRIKGHGSGPCIMLAGHLDTVGVNGYENPFEPAIKNGRVYGRGSCDMKAGLAVFIEVARVLIENKVELAGDLLIAGIADEEHSMTGSREISQNGPIPDFAIVGEPSELEVCHVHKGQLCMHIRTHGKACHSSVPEQGVNAISHMAKVLNGLADYDAELKARPAHPMCGHASFNPGVIEGGDIASSVPDFCQLEVDRRMLAGETVEQVVNEYRQRLDPIADQVDDFRYSISEPTLDTRALDTLANSAVVEHVAAAFYATMQKPTEFAPFSGSTDAPNLLCPAVICGPGSINQAHTLDEYVEIKQLTDAASIYLRAILSMQHT